MNHCERFTTMGEQKTRPTTCLNKKRYPSRVQAIIGMQRAQKKYGEEFKAARVYECNHCYFWHMTKAEQRG